MYKKGLLILCILSFPIASLAADKPSGGKVIAYYFYGNFRCATCYKFEQYSKGAMEENFKHKLASGRLVFNAINTDEAVNKHFINDYQLYTKSLVISLIKDGKEVESKNLVKIWDYVGDKQRFYDYVTEEIKNFLKES